MNFNHFFITIVFLIRKLKYDSLKFQGLKNSYFFLKVSYKI